jgi:hypothetical protein
MAEPHMSKRQNAREADGTQSSWETNGQDVQAFYQENVTLINRFVHSLAGNREEAEDLTSHVFLKAVHGGLAATWLEVRPGAERSFVDCP